MGDQSSIRQFQVQSEVTWSRKDRVHQEISTKFCWLISWGIQSQLSCVRSCWSHFSRIVMRLFISLFPITPQMKCMWEKNPYLAGNKFWCQSVTADSSCVTKMPTVVCRACFLLSPKGTLKFLAEPSRCAKRLLDDARCQLINLERCWAIWPPLPKSVAVQVAGQELSPCHYHGPSACAPDARHVLSPYVAGRSVTFGVKLW